jgi:hypothetical protein
MTLKYRRLKYLEILLSLFMLLAVIYMLPAKFLPVRAAECSPTDRDQYTYSPERFLILSSCVRVNGVVRGGAFSLLEGDGMFDVELDEPYRYTLNAMNERITRGHLHLEIVCFVEPEVTHWSHYTCKNDKTQTLHKLPRDGARIWAEGRWVWDLWHGHAELHPVYRWGELP